MEAHRKGTREKSRRMEDISGKEGEFPADMSRGGVENIDGAHDGSYSEEGEDLRSSSAGNLHKLSVHFETRKLCIRFSLSFIVHTFPQHFLEICLDRLGALNWIRGAFDRNASD